MSYSPTLGSVFNRTKMRDPSHVCSFSGMCAMCTADCIGSCEIGLSAVRGMETVYPTTTGENQIASEKVYPVDYSHFNINGRSFGAMGAPLDADRATIYHVGLEREIGTLNPVKLALPIILPALIKLNWPDYFGGAAMAGVNAVIGEGAVSKYTANSTFMHVVVPPWYHSRGTDGLLKALAEEREQVKKDMLTTEGWENFSQVMGWENIYVSSVASEKNLWCEGKSAVALGEALGKSPEDAVLDLLIEENLAVGLLGHGMYEEDVMEGMKHPTMCLITDGLLSGGKPHPRTYAAFPRFIARYVREKRLLTLEEAVRKMTSSTALKLRMKRKGFIMPGMDADMVVFGENRIRDVNTFENPRVYPEGIDYVLVNGEIAVDHGVHTGARPGKTIRD